MWTLSTWGRRSSARTSVLRLEQLETRDCPAPVQALLYAEAVPLDYACYCQSQAPTITLQVSYGQGRMVTLSGVVTDCDPGGLVVQFCGQVVGCTVTNEDGTFSLTAEAAGLGTVNAQTVNHQGLASNVASVQLASAAPVIHQFEATQEGGFWVFHGVVKDESPAGLIVTFGGLPSLEGQTAVVQRDGTFTLVIQLQPGEQGTATAMTTDWWGLDSNIAKALVIP